MWSSAGGYWKKSVFLVKEPPARLLDDLHNRSMNEPELAGLSARRWATWQQRHQFPQKQYPGAQPYDWLTKNLAKQRNRRSRRAARSWLLAVFIVV